MATQPLDQNIPQAKPDWAVYRHLNLFRGVSPDAVEHLIGLCFEAVYRRGEIILRAGGENRFIYLVLSGRLEVSLEGRSESPLVELGPGACVGTSRRYPFNTRT